MAKLRIRRMDQYNFVLEERSVVGATRKDGTPTNEPGAERWDNLGYYSSLESLLRGSLGKIIQGVNQKEILASVAQATAELVAALHEAVRDDALKFTVRKVSDEQRAALRRGRHRKTPQTQEQQGGTE